MHLSPIFLSKAEASVERRLNPAHLAGGPHKDKLIKSLYWNKRWPCCFDVLVLCVVLTFLGLSKHCKLPDYWVSNLLLLQKAVDIERWSVHSLYSGSSLLPLGSARQPSNRVDAFCYFSIGLCSSLVECYNSLSPSLWFAMSCEAIGVLLGTSA